MAVSPSSPHAPHAPEALIPADAHLPLRALILGAVAVPFLILAGLAFVQIATDTVPRSDATLSALNRALPAQPSAAWLRWSGCVRHGLHTRLDWLLPMGWSTVDGVMDRCTSDVHDTAIAQRAQRFKAEVAPLWAAH